MTLTTQLVLGAIPAEPTRERLKICQDAGLDHPGNLGGSDSWEDAGP
jgi:hypothetical protein